MMSPSTFQSLCLASSGLFLVGSSLVMIASIIALSSNSTSSSQDVAPTLVVAGWSIASSSVLPELYMDVLGLKNGTKRPDYGYHSRYGRGRNIFLGLFQSLLFAGGCICMAMGDLRQLEGCGSGLNFTNFYLAAGCSMTVSGLVAVTISGCCCCNPGDKTNRLCIIANSLFLGPAIVLLFAATIDGWCAAGSFGGFFAQLLAYGCWLTSAILWSVADCSLPKGGKEERLSPSQVHDPTTSVVVAIPNTTDHNSSNDGKIISDEEIEIR